MSALASAVAGDPDTGLAQPNAEGNVVGIARLLFTRYVFAFEVTSALLITAALGAMVLAHKERTGPVVTPGRDAPVAGSPATTRSPRPGPGVFADHDSTATPALLPDGSIARESVAAPLRDATEGDVPGLEGTVRRS